MRKGLYFFCPNFMDNTIINKEKDFAHGEHRMP